MLNYSLENCKELEFDKLKKLCFAESEKEFDEIVGHHWVINL